MFSKAHIAGVEANRTVKDELAAALSAQRARRRLSVTDLLNPRQAYFRRVHPEIVPSPDRLQRMLTGTGFHDLFGHLVSSEEFVEQFLEVDGIVGKVDIYEDIPTELKTSGSIPNDVAADRPAYIDQLGMYCRMGNARVGRLIVCKRTAWGQPPVMKAFRVEFADLEKVAVEMRRRRTLLLNALEGSDVSQLPPCEWRSLQCDYLPVCGCEAGSSLERIVVRDNFTIQEDADATRELIEKLAASRPRMVKGFRLNDLVFPRKALLERACADGAPEEESLEERLTGLERQGLMNSIVEALRYGSPGAFRGAPVALRELRGIVRTHNGVPTLLRSPRRPVLIERGNLADAFPHYFDRLAIECALLGSDKGRIVIYYAAIPGEKFMVYDVAWRDIPGILNEVNRRLVLLETSAE